MRKSIFSPKSATVILHASVILLTIVNACILVGILPNLTVKKVFETVWRIFTEVLTVTGIFILTTISQMIILQIKERKPLSVQTKLKLSTVLGILEIAKPATTLAYMAYFYLANLLSFASQPLLCSFLVITMILFFTIIVLDIVLLKRSITEETQVINEERTNENLLPIKLNPQILVVYYIFYAITLLVHFSEGTAFSFLTSDNPLYSPFFINGLVYCLGTTFMFFIEGGILIALSLIQTYLLAVSAKNNLKAKLIFFEVAKLCVTAVYIIVMFAMKRSAFALPLVVIWALSFISIIIADLKFIARRKCINVQNDYEKLN